MNHARALTLALATALISACASAPGAGALPPDPETGVRPVDNEATRAASLHLVQAGMGQGEAQFQEAMADALVAIQQMPENPKAYLLAGQAAIGLHDWVRADTMLDRAVELYPRYQEEVVQAEREQAWANAYNLGAQALQGGDVETARAMFEGADVLYTGRPEARIALGSLYATEGDVEAAARAYMGALDILNAAPPAGLTDEEIEAWEQDRLSVTFNAAQLIAQAGDYERAVDLLQGFLDEQGSALDPQTQLRVRTALAGYLAQSGDAAAAEAMYDELMNRSDLGAAEYFQMGVGFFNTADYDRAADAFLQAAELNPYSRDALLNAVQALYSEAVDADQEGADALSDEELRAINEELLDAAQQVRALDPLNRNVISFMLRAYRNQADLVPQAQLGQLEQNMRALYREYEAQAFEVSGIRLGMETASRARINGTLTNLTGTPGETVTLAFEVLNLEGGTIDDARIETTLPAQGESLQFTATVDVPSGGFAGWRYEVLE